MIKSGEHIAGDIHMNNDESYNVLIIDDNPSIHEDFRKVLLTQTKGELSDFDAAKTALFGKMDDELSFPLIHIDSAFQGQEGLELVKKKMNSGHYYSMAFVDVRMPPGWDGVETISKIWKLDPNILMVICTAAQGYTWSDIVKQLGQSDKLLFLRKPYDTIEVRQLASSLIQKWLLARQVKKQLEELRDLVNKRTQALEQTSALISAVLRSSRDGVLVVDNTGKIIEYNHKFVEMWQIPDEIVKSKDDNKAIGFVLDQLESPKQFLDKVKELYNDTEKTSLDRLNFKDGQVFERYTLPLKINGTTIARLWNFHDVSGNTSKDNFTRDIYHAVLNKTRDCILVLDASLKIIDVSKNTTHILDKSKLKKMNNTHLMDIVALDKNQVEMILQLQADTELKLNIQSDNNSFITLSLNRIISPSFNGYLCIIV